MWRRRLLLGTGLPVLAGLVAAGWWVLYPVGAQPRRTARPAPAAPSGPPRETLPYFADDRLSGVPRTLGQWSLTGRTDVFGPASDQGLTVVRTAGLAPRIVYTGGLGVDAALRAAGWVHVGAPGSWRGWLVEPFQGGPGAKAKMFRVTSPSGKVVEAVHELAPGEAPNNSFAAVTPDGRWTVSGEWGDESRLLVFPTPGINPAAAGPSLALAGIVALET